MRVYRNFKEALGEIQRDLKEHGHRVHPQTYQDKFVGDNPDFATMEYANYIYTVTGPMLGDLNPTQPWADLEFNERVDPNPQNPGQAWVERSDIWSEFLQEDGRFAYTYNERIRRYGISGSQIGLIVDRLIDDPDSRQCFMGIWDPYEDMDRLGGISRVPCTLGYQFQIRQGKLNITYLQRSADFATHFVNDVYLAHRMQRHIATHVGVDAGHFVHWVGSLHVFQKDVAEVF